MTQDAETVARLEALEALEEKATPGVWGVASDLPAYAIYAGKYRVVQTPNQNNYQTYGRSERWLGIEHKADADLIAALRNDALPLIRSLSTRLAAAEAERDRAKEWSRQLTEANGKMRAALQEIADGREVTMRNGTTEVVDREDAPDIARAALQPGAPDA